MDWSSKMRSTAQKVQIGVQKGWTAVQQEVKLCNEVQNEYGRNVK